MTKEELNNAVVSEAENLMIYSNKAERDKINIETLNPLDPALCIYGQMSGNCNNQRASFLVERCCTHVCVYSVLTDIGLSITDVDNLIDINALKATEKSRWKDYSYSPIEVFIAKNENQKNGNNKMLVDFLKGKITTLRFK